MPREELLRQIDVLAKSDLLHGSETLCRLLTYLATQAVDHPGASPKEHQIAMEVFHQPESFDPRLNATVRVQTGRLRTKLAEYYAGPGAGSPVIVQIAKGSYSLSAIPAPTANVAPDVPEPLPASPAPERPVPQRNDWRIPLLSIAVICLTALLAWTAFRKQPAAAASTSSRPRLEEKGSLQTFWMHFRQSSRNPMVVFSNANFVGRPETGLRYFVPSRDRREAILDHYTGVGEVLAVHELGQVFSGLDKELRVKRSGLLSLDDAKEHDLIFIGSPTENLPLRELPGTKQFEFQLIPRRGQPPELAIVSSSPQAGEARQYVASPGSPIREDYAIVGLLPGLGPARRTLILAGTTTLGTEGAAEFVCSNSSVADLLKRLEVQDGGLIPFFEMVIRIGISGGVPVRSEIMAVRRRQ